MATYRLFHDLLSASDARIADLLYQATEEDCVLALRGASAQMRARFLQQMARPLRTHMVERINQDVVNLMMRDVLLRSSHLLPSNLHSIPLTARRTTIPAEQIKAPKRKTRSTSSRFRVRLLFMTTNRPSEIEGGQECSDVGAQQFHA